MPSYWSPRDESMYQHILASESKDRSAKKAKIIAAATVNKRRREEGRTQVPPKGGKG